MLQAKLYHTFMTFCSWQALNLGKIKCFRFIVRCNYIIRLADDFENSIKNLFDLKNDGAFKKSLVI